LLEIKSNAAFNLAERADIHLPCRVFYMHATMIYPSYGCFQRITAQKSDFGLYRKPLFLFV